MARFTCPSCAAALTQREIMEGWCKACGKKLPYGLVAEAADKAGATAPCGNQPGDPRATLAGWLGWFSLLGLLFSLAACLGLPLWWQWLPVGRLPLERQDYLIGEFASGLFFLILGFVLLWLFARRFRR